MQRGNYIKKSAEICNVKSDCDTDKVFKAPNIILFISNIQEFQKLKKYKI